MADRNNKQTKNVTIYCQRCGSALKFSHIESYDTATGRVATKIFLCGEGLIGRIHSFFGHTQARLYENSGKVEVVGVSTW